MKWSEQMRVLNSEDEHYNQLIYDNEEKTLYINEKLIARLDEEKYLDQNTFYDLKKNYPYIDDKNFLLNCLFKVKNETPDSSNPSNIVHMTYYSHTTFVSYTESTNGSYIEVGMITGNTLYSFKFNKPEILDEPKIA